MARLVPVPSHTPLGLAVTIRGEEFTPKSAVRLEIHNSAIDLNADAAGMFSTIDEGDHAAVLLTSDNVLPANGDTITIDGVQYFFGIPMAPYHIKINKDGDATMANLKSCINKTGLGDGSDYAAGTPQHPTVAAGELDTTANTLMLYVKQPGVAGNSKTVSVVSAHLSLSSGTFQDGRDGTGKSFLDWHPDRIGNIKVTASDSRKTATAFVRAWAGT